MHALECGLFKTTVDRCRVFSVESKKNKYLKYLKNKSTDIFKSVSKIHFKKSNRTYLTTVNERQVQISHSDFCFEQLSRTHKKVKKILKILAVFSGKITMPLKTTVIGAWPKPDYLKIPDWFKSGHGKGITDLKNSN